MAEDPVRHQYQPKDRAEVFEFLRASMPADAAARMIAQWEWKFERNPAQPPTIDIIRIGDKLVATAIGFRLRMWAGGIECFGEARGMFLTHPEYRGRRIWQRVGARQADDTPVLFGWSVLPVGTVMDAGWTIEPLRPLVRILDAGPLLAHLTHSAALASIGRAVSAAGRAACAPFRRAAKDRNPKLVRMTSFDDRADALWESARRPDKAMVVRDRRYLNWRYGERPDAGYLLYGIEHGATLAGFLVARLSGNRGMRWGYLVDFLVQENSSAVLSSLVAEALDDLRRAGAVAVSCHATDPTARRGLFRHGFFPSPRRPSVNVNRRILPQRPDLRRFESLREWYLTMGDADYDMVF